MASAAEDVAAIGLAIRVRGIVQGVGFRPTVWRLARDLRIRGAVWNDADGVLIHAWGLPPALDEFVRRIESEPPPLARIDAIESSTLDADPVPDDFAIVASRQGRAATDVAPDGATCPACLAETLDPANRRYRYPFTNCTHCGPRLSIVRSIPYDRVHTSMAAFEMCPACRAEYHDPADRRFHAQPNACPECGPRTWLEDRDGEPVAIDGAVDAIDAARRLLVRGAIVAIKGIGGIHLACDACNPQAVDRLRQRKRRYHKAFALLARDAAMVERYAVLDARERRLLEDRAAPIVVLRARGAKVARGVAPGQRTLGFMLPYSPLHHLLMRDLDRPIVLTSGNRHHEPQCIANADARDRLRDIADYFLLHDREILKRLDDSVVRVMAGEARLLRRARGYAPAPVSLPAGFDRGGQILAMGGELKNTFCLTYRGKAVLSQHMGDLEEAAVLDDYRNNLGLYRALFDHDPVAIAVDRHPDYFSTRVGRRMAVDAGVPLIEVQHHHAHIAACMAEHGLPADAAPVLGIALDGLGFGDDGTLWGGEFMLAGYGSYRRLARFAPVPLLGGARAMHEPWRNAFAHLCVAFGWQSVLEDYGDVEIVRYLCTKPVDTLQAMFDRGLNSPSASSCGRLFDAVAAAVGVCRTHAGYEGQAAIELEALAVEHFRRESENAYPVAWVENGELAELGWAPFWKALLNDLRHAVDPAIIAARFHQTVVQSVADNAVRLCMRNGIGSVVLGGGVFQNRLLLEGIREAISKAGLRVLIPGQIPANDGGLALGQAVIAKARLGRD
jgi:hydrogenase maturation protein HypF